MKYSAIVLVGISKGKLGRMETFFKLHDSDLENVALLQQQLRLAVLIICEIGADVHCNGFLQIAVKWIHLY